MVKKIFKITCMIMTLSLVVNTDTHAFFFFNKGVKNNSSEVLNKNSVKNTTLSITNVRETLIEKLTSQSVKNSGNIKVVNGLNLSKLFNNVNGFVTINNSLTKNSGDIDFTVNSILFKDRFKDRFLASSAENIILIVIDVDEGLTNKLALQMIKTRSEFEFRGFNFNNIDNNAINGLNLLKLFDNVNGSIALTNLLVKNSGDIDFNCFNCEDEEGY